MIQREWQKVKVITFTDELDDYKQKRQTGETETEIEMVFKEATQTVVDNPKYIDIDAVGITLDKTITDKNQIEVNGKRYNVKFTIPSGRYLQVLMKNE